MQTTQISKKLTKRSDYAPSDYLIRTTKLVFEIGEKSTTVRAEIAFYKNPKIKKCAKQLFLNGTALTLLEIFIDGKTAKYEKTALGIFIYPPGEKFTLSTKVCIRPHKNTVLSGLYQSSGNFVTQCEAHGFSRITYYLDRPDVLAVFTTTIIADKKHFPVQLSNGDLIDKKSNRVVWHDKTPKPCYLFALVVGDLVCREAVFRTRSGRDVALKIYVEAHNLQKTEFAMRALKNAFSWDETRFGLEYDLDTYMIVAIDDFNMGAMENKGLNIFNSHYVLASLETATDANFEDIEAVIGHEYFHNWTGNRITCRDWFQLSLKEGLTVFREQEFCADGGSRAVRRIEDVIRLRAFQFAEDAGTMRHAVRPESYLEVNNFYTATVYEKGAELVRMLHTILGEGGFMAGMQKYIAENDGGAATVEDFVGAMARANGRDFSQFLHWYQSVGTPVVELAAKFFPERKIFEVRMRQKTLDKKPLVIPINYGLIDKKTGDEIQSGTLMLRKMHEIFVFENINTEPLGSWLRGFSAPIKLKTKIKNENRILLALRDSDAFVRFDNIQQIFASEIQSGKFDHSAEIFTHILKHEKDLHLAAKLLALPSEKILQNEAEIIDVFEIRKKRDLLIRHILENTKTLLHENYERLAQKNRPIFSNEQTGLRAYKNLCLAYLAHGGEFSLAFSQYQNARLMTDRFAALAALFVAENDFQNAALGDFYEHYQNDVQVMDKYFSVQAGGRETTISEIQKLTKHPLFSYASPNRVRSLIGVFAHNFCQFHTPKAYEFFTATVLKIDAQNPQLAANLASVYNHWRRFEKKLSAAQKSELEKMAAHKNLSDDVFEIIGRALNDG